MNIFAIFAVFVNAVYSQGKIKNVRILSMNSVDPGNWMNYNPVAEDPIMDVLNLYADNHEPSVYDKRNFDRRSKWMKNRVRLNRH